MIEEASEAAVAAFAPDAYEPHDRDAVRRRSAGDRAGRGSACAPWSAISTSSSSGPRSTGCCAGCASAVSSWASSPTSRRRARERLARAGIGDLFDYLGLSALTGLRKPDPRAFSGGGRGAGRIAGRLHHGGRPHRQRHRAGQGARHGDDPVAQRPASPPAAALAGRDAGCRRDRRARARSRDRAAIARLSERDGSRRSGGCAAAPWRGRGRRCRPPSPAARRASSPLRRQLRAPRLRGRGLGGELGQVDGEQLVVLHDHAAADHHRMHGRCRPRCGRSGSPDRWSGSS